MSNQPVEPMSGTTTTSAEPKKPERKYFVNFNQDSTSLAIGNKSGYKLYPLTNVEDLEPICASGTEDTCIVERLFSSSLVAIVQMSAPRKLKVCHFKKGTEICNYSYSNTILTVRLNRSRLVVCLEGSLYIHNIRDMKVLHTIRDTPPNPKGICALSIGSDTCYVAYPGSCLAGEVQIFDTINLHAKILIHAHDSPLAAVAFTSNGQRVATASEKGTVIRICSTADGKKLYEFRRGVKRCVEISSLAFSMCGQYLGSSSNTETVHIFKLEEPKETPQQSAEESGWMGYLSTYLPSQVTDVFTQGRSFATAHLPFSGVKTVITIISVMNQLRLLVVTEDGNLLVYNIDPNEPGDLVLYKQHRLDGSEEEAADAEATDTDAGKTEPVNIETAESDKIRAMLEATETPPSDGFHFNYEQDYPPLATQAASE